MRVYSNVAIQLGKKRGALIGDIASTYTGTSKGPPCRVFRISITCRTCRAWRLIWPTCGSLLTTYDTTYSNASERERSHQRRRASGGETWLVRHQRQWLYRRLRCGAGAHQSGLEQDQSFVDGITSGQFVNPNTGQPYDSDL